MTRIAVISDLHSNWEALQAVWADLPDVDRVVCLGDIVGYGANPVEVLDFLRTHRIDSIKGNHDHAVATMNTEGFNDYAASAVRWTRKQLDEARVDYLRDLPETLAVPELDALLVHGAPRNPLFEYLDDSEKARAAFGVPNRILLVGHSHAAFRCAMNGGGPEFQKFPDGGRGPIGSRAIINPGSVGQPRDGNPKASYAVVTEDEFEIRRVAYDVAGAARKIRAAGLPGYLAARLGGGR